MKDENLTKSSEPQTPLMAQYFECKNQHPDAILFMRCGDFYEMFHEDARIASRELQITLTSRNKNSEDPVPMAGVPYHAYEDYAARLIQKGYKVALCEQMEDPKQAKGIVKRKIISVLTPGTAMLSKLLQPKKNQYLGVIYPYRQTIFYALADVTTGECRLGFKARKDLPSLASEMLRLGPGEIVYYKSLAEEEGFPELCLKPWIVAGIHLQMLEKAAASHTPLFSSGQYVQKAVLNASLLPENREWKLLLEFLFQHLETIGARVCFGHVSALIEEERLILDPATLQHLEILASTHSGGRTLFDTIDHTVSASGGRKLRQILASPLRNRSEIERRLDAVESLYQSPQVALQLRQMLSSFCDMHRLVQRLLNQHLNPREILALAQSLLLVPEVFALAQAQGIETRAVSPVLLELAHKIVNSVCENPAIKVAEGAVFRFGVHQELDHYRSLVQDSDAVLNNLEAKEREISGIKTLKLKFNRVFGYYFEVPSSMADKMPQHFIRKQTLANAERFTSVDLKKLEVDLLKAQFMVQSIEAGLLQDLCSEVLIHGSDLILLAEELAYLDVLLSFALLASKGAYTRPEFLDTCRLHIEKGRHPVVETTVQDFVANDLFLDAEIDQLALITGPNMGGKSTYLRQTALLVLLAQAGSFVPAAKYSAGIFDQIFTRIGASDNLSAGKSTFLVEMSETAYLLQNATKNSLILMDEIGRGTATFDGLSLAWAVVEHILADLGSLCLFATHYHELVQLQKLSPRIKNLYLACEEIKGEIFFLHQIRKGAANKSYGIQVARLAGLPASILNRASFLLKELESSKATVIGLESESQKLIVKGRQNTLLKPESKPLSPIEQKLENIRPDTLSPREALEILYSLKDLLHSDI